MGHRGNNVPSRPSIHKSFKKEEVDSSLAERYKYAFGARDLPVAWKHGRRLETTNTYNKLLRVTIQYRLMEDYGNRISSRDLLVKAMFAAARYDVIGAQEDWDVV